MIDTTEALQEVVEALRDAEWLGLDVEGDGLYRYRSRLCTIQLAADSVVEVIDGLAIEDLSALGPLLDEDGPRKVVHDVSFDRKMLATRGLPLGRVFDTAVAARFLSEPSTGLAALLEKHFGVELDKKFQQADWGERPLDDARLAYLTADVRHLAKLAMRFEADASELDLLEEIQEETLYAMDRALEPEKEREPWTRIKGGRDLPPPARALLKALADVRETEAEERDVPPFRVASNRVLFEAARRRARKVKDLRRIRGLRTLSDEHLDRALALAERDGPPSDTPEPPPPPEIRAERKARERALSAWRSTEAERRGVDAQAILPGHCLRDLTRLESDDLEQIAGLGQKRIERYGESLVSLLRAADGSDD